MTFTSLDHAATLALNFDGGLVLDRFMWLASAKLTWAPLYLALLWLIYRKYGWKYMLVMLLAVLLGVALSDQICNYFKETYQMLRPNRVEGVKEGLHLVWNPIKEAFCIYGRYGTVSAHAATTMSICGYWLWGYAPLSHLLVAYGSVGCDCGLFAHLFGCSFPLSGALWMGFGSTRWRCCLLATPKIRQTI